MLEISGKNSLNRLLTGKCVGYFLINEWQGKAQPMSGSATPALVGFIKKQDEQALKSKPVSTTPPRPLLQSLPPAFCLKFRSWLPSIIDCKPGNESSVSPFFPQVALDHGVSSQ